MFKLLEYIYEKGYIGKWFSWIEAMTLTAGLLLVGFKYELWPVSLLGYISCVLLWFATYYTLISGFINTAHKINAPRWLKLVVGYPYALIVPTVSFALIGYSLYGFIVST
jgi:hypothetical protein